MSICAFTTTYPEYLLDRLLVLNGTHKHRVSGYKLATCSEFFKTLIWDIRSKELEKNKKLEDETSENQRSGRKRTRSISEIETDTLYVDYENVIAFEVALSFMHAVKDEQNPTYLNFNLTEKIIGDVLNVADHFKIQSLLEFCFNFIKANICSNFAWEYWRAALSVSASYLDIKDFVREYILENFMSVAMFPQVCYLAVEELISYLRDDKINCTCEIELMKVINIWIGHDVENRVQFCRRLLECLRLGRLTHDELTLVCANEYVQRAWSECEQVIVFARLSIEDLTSSSSSPSVQSGDGEAIANYIKTPRYPRAAIFVVGGWEGNQEDPNFGPSKAIQVYDSRARQWNRFTDGPMALDEGHAYSGCILLGSKIYIVGGYSSRGPTQTLKMYDCELKVWKYLSPMHEKRNYVCSASLKGFLYAVGGHNGKVRLNTIEKYDVVTNQWKFVSPMSSVRSDAGADSCKDKLYVCGGFDGHQFFSSVEMYDSVTDQWSMVQSMLSVRSGVCVIEVAGYLYALGGNSGQSRLNSIERYDPDENEWRAMPSMLRKRSNFTVTLMEGEVYAMGGWSDETQSTISVVEKWLPGMTSTWVPVKELHLPASANCSCAIKGLSNIKDHLQSRDDEQRNA